nr:putative SH3 domain-containing protein [Ipomoea batatas]
MDLLIENQKLVMENIQLKESIIPIIFSDCKMINDLLAQNFKLKQRAVPAANLAKAVQLQISDQKSLKTQISHGLPSKSTNLCFFPPPPPPVNEFLAGAGIDAPDVDEENVVSRPSMSYDDMWAKTLMETSKWRLIRSRVEKGACEARLSLRRRPMALRRTASASAV